MNPLWWFAIIPGLAVDGFVALSVIGGVLVLLIALAQAVVRPLCRAHDRREMAREMRSYIASLPSPLIDPRHPSTRRGKP